MPRGPRSPLPTVSPTPILGRENPSTTFPTTSAWREPRSPTRSSDSLAAAPTPSTGRTASWRPGRRPWLAIRWVCKNRGPLREALWTRGPSRLTPASRVCTVLACPRLGSWWLSRLTFGALRPERSTISEVAKATWWWMPLTWRSSRTFPSCFCASIWFCPTWLAVSSTFTSRRFHRRCGTAVSLLVFELGQASLEHRGGMILLSLCWFLSWVRQD